MMYLQVCFFFPSLRVVFSFVIATKPFDKKRGSRCVRLTINKFCKFKADVRDEQ